MPSRRRIRLALLALLAVSVSLVAYGAVTAERTGTAADVPDAPPRENVTVATESARYGTIMAWSPNGSRLYYADEHTKYFDVDPVAGEPMTVEYAATDTIHTSGPTCTSPPCTRNVIERVDLSTGETTEIYARYDPRETAAEWHDHARINETHVLVADMVHDQVFIVNTETEIVEWRWDAQSEYAVEGGGPYPRDWTHLNDVEYLPDGRVMVSLRNQDLVAFVEPGSGLEENWTLGSDGDHDVLYEQHNPDYIPESRGGPAVVVADSENGRLVEYQRADGAWNRTWTWTDARLQWPRDADRLPNGNTLATDTHGSRLLEIAPNGSVVWQVPLAHPYDVERLGTGEGSSGGESAARLDLAARTDSTSVAGDGDVSSGDEGGGWGFDPLAALRAIVVDLFPSRIGNAIYYVAPVWMGAREFLGLGLGLVALVVWSALELRWRVPDLSLRSPVVRETGDAVDDEPTVPEDGTGAPEDD